MSRFSGKGRKPRGRGAGRPSGFRPPPPSGTGLEARFLEETVRSGEPVALSLDDGQTLRGVVKSCDRDQLTIEQNDAEIVIRKTRVRYITEG